MKANLIYKLFFIFFVSINIVVLYKNTKLKKQYNTCEYLRNINVDNKIQLEGLVESNIFRINIENDFSLTEVLNNKHLRNNTTATRFFFFHEYDCEICVSKVLNDIKKFEGEIIIIGDFCNDEGFKKAKKHYGLGDNFYHINYLKELNFNTPNHKPFWAVIEKNAIKNIFIIEKSFDKSYYHYINHIVKKKDPFTPIRI